MSPPFGWKPERFCSKRRPSGNNPFSALQCCIEATAIPSIPGNSWVSWVSVVHLDIPPWRDGYQRLVVRRWKSQWGRYPLSCRRFRGGRAWGGGSWQGWGDGWGGKVPEIFFFKSLPSERLGSKLWLNCELYVYIYGCLLCFFWKISSFNLSWNFAARSQSLRVFQNFQIWIHSVFQTFRTRISIRGMVLLASYSRNIGWTGTFQHRLAN